MKRILMIIIFIFSLFCGIAIAEDVELAWDANTEADLVGYLVYRSEIPGEQYVFLYFIECEPNDASCTNYWDENLPYSKALYWVVTAIDDASNESDYSNEVSHTTGPAPNPPPNSPTGCYIKSIQ